MKVKERLIPMIKNIVFDIGNVLVKFDWQGYLSSFGYPRSKYESIADATFRNPDWSRLDEGILSYEELEALFCSHAPQYASDISLVLKDFWKAITRFPYTKPWLLSLKKQGFRLYYLSNYASFTRENTKAELDFCKLMDGGLMSYQVRLVKPNPAFYQCLFQTYGLSPKECIFLDDSPANIRQAAALGMHTILFRQYDDAVRELERICSQNRTITSTDVFL